jgi:hypothetical protein
MLNKKQTIEWTIAKLASAYAKYEADRTEENRKAVIMQQMNLRELGFNVVMLTKD